MPRFLYCFGFETPRQAANNTPFGWDDEDSRAVWIVAPSEAAAFEWGMEVSERWVAYLFNDPAVAWKAGNFARWIEAVPQETFTAGDLEELPVIQHGEFPDFARWL